MAAFYLTARVIKQLHAIKTKSERDFGIPQTKIYINNIYKGFENIAHNENKDKLRQSRSDPFHMHPVGVNHFALYHRFDNYVVIAAVFDQKMNIERHIEKLKQVLSKEISLLHDFIKSKSTD